MHQHPIVLVRVRSQRRSPASTESTRSAPPVAVTIFGSRASDMLAPTAIVLGEHDDDALAVGAFQERRERPFDDRAPGERQILLRQAAPAMRRELPAAGTTHP